ncbi:myoD family inhibitor domain-containing protein 2-like isoform X1 [Huso huso]|uniref:MyoD family inhibitor domain-containing protein 2-like isoform X1 n=1 Tax=Huso huso TaxID=61971 RepID=A0ABR0YNM6_HUSHU
MASQNPDKDDSKETIGNIEESSLLSNGNVHQSLNEVPLNGEPVNELRDNDTGPEYKATETITDVPSKESLEESKWGGSRLSLCLVEKSVGSYACNGNSQFQPDNGDECATLTLNCLFCHFYDFFLMLPDMCESLVRYVCCCPSRRYQFNSNEHESNNDCLCNCDFDGGCFDVCYDASECLELAMEISEVCYR